MHRRLLPIMFVVAVTLAGAAALLALRAGAAPAAPGAAAPGARIFLPAIQRGPETAVSLPDLAVTSVRFHMKGYTSGCLPWYDDLVLLVCVHNRGQGDAGPFVVAVRSYEAATSPGLKAGETACLETTFAPGNPVDVTVDPADNVPESDESNNYWYGWIPVPTPPPLCTATPWPNPTATPTATAMP